MEQITLLEGVPFERELASLGSKYRSTKFEGLFRTSKINVYPSYIQPLPQAPYQAPYQSPYQPTHTSYPNTQAAYSQSTSSPTFIQPTPPHRPAQVAVQRPVSTSTNGSTMKMNPAAPTWASAATSAPAQVATREHPQNVPTPNPLLTSHAVSLAPPTPQQDPPVPRIDRNKYGQRVDPTLIYDKESVRKMRGLHLCQNHYLRECTYGDGCVNRHDYNPSKNELHTLKVVARQTPCKFGTDCDDPYCTYGHK